MNRRKLLNWVLASPIIIWSGIAAAKESNPEDRGKFTRGWVKDQNGKDCYVIVLSPAQYSVAFGKEVEETKKMIERHRAGIRSRIVRFVVNYT